jgi:ubiquinone/menaquinone biosynthesis C-methylase UbiE
MNSNIITYYKDRAKEYERIYDKPERQNDLQHAGHILQNIFKGKKVFEIACGTGYWTNIIAKAAHSILATDINETVLEVAKSKSYSPGSVDFLAADIFNMKIDNKYDSLFGGFIWSHIKLQDLKSFLAMAENCVESGGTIVFMDNNYVEGSSLPITETDTFGNTYQTRTLENGTTHMVLKNFPFESFMRELIADKVVDLEYINLEYYWIMKYKRK